MRPETINISDVWLTLSVSSPKPLLMEDGEVFVLLAGRPTDPSYLESLSSLLTAMTEAKSQFSFTTRPGSDRRGKYKAIATGVTHGGGSQVRFMELTAGMR